MFRFQRYTKQGLYHVALIVVAVTAFNWGFVRVTNIDVVARLFQGAVIPDMIVAVAVCISAVIVLWHNWVD